MSTGCDNDQMHHDLYSHFATASAWKVTEGAVAALEQLRASGQQLCCSLSGRCPGLAEYVLLELLPGMGNL